MEDTETTGVGPREKALAVYEALQYRPLLGITIVVLSSATAVLEGLGLGFILPIIEIARNPAQADTSRVVSVFIRFYELIGVPLTLEYLLLGIASVITVRSGLGLLTQWLRAVLGLGYQKNLKQELFQSFLYSPIDYLDQAGSDELLNSLITETSQGGGVLITAFSIVETLFRGIAYLGLAIALSPRLTLVALLGLGSSTLLVRYGLEPAYDVGNRVAELNERVQTISQTGLQGMRDVRLYNLREEMASRMRDTLDESLSVNVRLRRNNAALSQLNQLSNALVVFSLVYLGFRFTDLSLGTLGVFLFAVFRLSPVLNQLNSKVYALESALPHLIRVLNRRDDIADRSPTDVAGSDPVGSVRRLEFDDVTFGYEDEEPVLRDVSIEVSKGEKIALVGPSGAGKSTTVALLGRLQLPDSGQILADRAPITDLDIEEWRDRLAVVRQNAFLFDGTLRENLTIGARDASEREIDRACDIAQVTEFFSDLPNGYETELGEDGVRLSGGQKQRVAIARALLKDADVLVFDEATSELDSNIERDVYEAVERMREQYITIVIAHRLSTVNDADRIYTLVDGSVVEVGTHAQLLDHEGQYADLYSTQS